MTSTAGWHEDGIPTSDFTIATQLYHCLGEYYLQVADFTNRRSRCARQLHDYAAPAPDHNHLAQAHGLLARIALGRGRPGGGSPCSCPSALSIVDNADFPLASWRVYHAATEILMKTGEPGEAIKYQNRFEAVVRRLAQNFEPGDRLYNSLSTAVAARTARWGLVV